LRQESDRITIAPRRSGRVNCTRAFFLSPPGYGTRRVVDYQGTFIYQYGRESSIDSPAVVGCKNSLGDLMWAHPLPRRMWCDLGPAEDGRLYMRVFDKLEDATLRASLVVMETSTGSVSEFPSQELVPPYEFFWLGRSRFAHVYRGILEIWAIDEKLRKVQVYNFGASLAGFQVDSLGPDEIAVVHHNARNWFIANIQTGKIETRLFYSPEIVEMQERARKSARPESTPALSAIGTDGSGTLVVVGVPSSKFERGCFPFVTIRPDGRETETLLQMPYINGTSPVPFWVFPQNSEFAIWSPGDAVACFPFS
jgi:hypothetical protein